MKKFKKSPIAIVCYIIASIFAVYFIAVIFSTLHSINEYYASYDMQAGFGETLGYLLQNGLGPLTNAILIFMAGFILDEVRKLNPANWMTEEEIAEAREATESVEAVFVSSDEEAEEVSEETAEVAEEAVEETAEEAAEITEETAEEPDQE